MTALSSNEIVAKLRDQYSGGSMYGHELCSSYSAQGLINTGFIGSSNVVFLSSKNKIVHEAPACIAAPLVNMVAKEVVCMGMQGQGEQPVPVRIYAPGQLSITAKHVSVGDIMMIVEPQFGFITCKKLTLSKSTEEDPAHFEIVKSWVLGDDTEIETVSRT